MSAMASQITSLMIVNSTIYSGADQRKHQSSASLAFVRGIHCWPENSPHKWPVTRENVSIWWRHHDKYMHGNWWIVRKPRLSYSVILHGWKDSWIYRNVETRAYYILVVIMPVSYWKRTWCTKREDPNADHVPVDFQSLWLCLTQRNFYVEIMFESYILCVCSKIYAMKTHSLITLTVRINLLAAADSARD